MRKIIGVVIGGFAIAGLLTLAPIPADAGAPHSLDVTKTVVGPGPTGPYAIEVVCTGFGDPSPSSFDLNDGESQPVALSANDTTCTVTETGTQGAAVSYACGNTTNATCDTNQTVTVNPAGNAQIDITNTFATPAPAPAPVEAQPTFTG